MKTTCVYLLLGLVLMGIWDSEAESPGPPIPAICCFSFIGFSIPANKIKSAVKTNPYCVKEAVVSVTTERGNSFCVKPDEPWLQAIISNNKDS
ncbi:C-C motif chemokine 24-like [Triplophysa dalaica]|uniref:C-C motif chemokine 24-like n=1 Tax=Triplophysa dalaica TaxID=1582913 RepID=UPI0024DF5AEB|nr:C-C motif chemokine 24-like [Triplophysa dalaica]